MKLIKKETTNKKIKSLRKGLKRQIRNKFNAQMSFINGNMFKINLNLFKKKLEA